ncbi:MAG: GHMP kinase [Candidatus Aenigmatarchaeota archaeon]
MIIRSRSPVRVSFGGGGTDCSPYCDENGGCVVSATINKYAYATLMTRLDQEIHVESADFLKSVKFGHVNEIVYNNELDLLKVVIKKMNTSGMGLNIFMRSSVPPKSGLGGSAAVFAAMIGLFNHMKREKKMTDYEVAELAHHLERDELKIGGGRQDQYATVFGGLNFIEFGKGWVRVNPLKMKKDHLLELEKNLILVYAGDKTVSSIQADIITDQMKSYTQKNVDVVEALNKTKEIAQDMRYALLRGDFERFGNLLHEGWVEKKKFSSLMTTPHINNLYDIAKKNGALGGKITGSGGGGFMLFYCEPNKEHIVLEKLEQAGARPFTFTFDMEGLQTWECEDKRGV